MSRKSLKDVADKMSGIDIAILSTHGPTGQIVNRPMSNNGDVEYNGTSYYFTFEESQTVSDIERDKRVGLGFTGTAGWFSGGVYIAVEGDAELIRDRSQFKAHWTSDLDKWFKQGIDTPNLVLVKVRANKVKCWDGGEEADVVL